MDVLPVLDWTEKHAGFGSWIGAIGAVGAIFVTWALSRAEYLRVRRQEHARRRREVDLIATVIHEFDELMKGYIRAAKEQSTGVNDFYQEHINHPNFLGMRDLADMPLISWPSSDLFMMFKLYWSSSLRLLELSKSSVIRKPEFRFGLQSYEVAMRALQVALRATRE